VGVEEEKSNGTEVRAEMEMYGEAETAVQVEGKKTTWFKIKSWCASRFCAKSTAICSCHECSDCPSK